MNNPAIPVLLEKARQLPGTPGVYIMKNRSGKVIYIGKAKSLRNRVTQYFSLVNGIPRAAGNPDNTAYVLKVSGMVENAADFDYILTDSEFEALVLEASLIKQHRPKYNILLKDDKGYMYIRVTQGEWPRIDCVRQKKDDGAQYIGPYTGGYSVSGTVEEAKKLFLLPQCSRRFPEDIGRNRPCLNYSIKQCSAPCAGKISVADYNEAVKNALDFVINGSAGVVKELTRQMEEAAENLEFEKAARLRDRITAIGKSGQRQKVMGNSIEEQDVFALVGASGDKGNKACLAVLRFADSRLYDSEYFIIDMPGNTESARSELLREYYTMRSVIPPRVALDGKVEDEELLAQWLTSLRGKKVTIVYPQRGAQKELLEMCRSNAAQKLGEQLGRTGRSTAALDQLAQILGLAVPPDYIESYDISHTAGSDNVAGMVVFRSGVPYRKAYRKFSIKGFTGQDDYASMAEVIERRIIRYYDEKDSGEGFGRLPDLILLDGGAGQVNAVKAVLDRYGLDIPLFGMVKDSRHRTRAIATGGGEISLTSGRSAFTLVSTIQEEVHRFAIGYHHQKHALSSLTSTLTSVEGVGKARAAALLKAFKTMKAISQADVGALAGVKGMSRTAAEAVYDYFHPDKN